ncbi:hypothetical protein [Limnohabitans sp.]|uniref:hypothetical protein n=1 Tax=Limnohabitans sp. TaxID=1907725 RepID=UPI0025C5F020|nr:hypothetical protein [Limnohabitans sp.]
MNKILKSFGAIFIALIFISAIAMSVASSKISKLEGEAVQFINSEIPQITKEWDSNILYEIASPDLKAKASSEDLSKLFKILSSLGKLNKLNAPNGNIKIKFFGKNNSSNASGYFECQSDFEKGPAVIKLTLEKYQDQWLVSSFHINSVTFLEIIKPPEKQ